MGSSFQSSGLPPPRTVARTLSQCSTAVKAAAESGSTSRKLWMCCSTGRTSRSSVATLTSHRAVAPCASAAPPIRDRTSGLMRARSPATTGMPASVIISAWIADSLVPLVSWIRVLRCITQSATLGTNHRGSTP
ncbi:hypothetical protein KGS77_04075 [Streptomyces sp. MST-110588]|nr:hypothetical protein KGS77_04075 [Streptomyces sp. MST-110588]